MDEKEQDRLWPLFDKLDADEKRRMLYGDWLAANQVTDDAADAQIYAAQGILQATLKPGYTFRPMVPPVYKAGIAHPVQTRTVLPHQAAAVPSPTQEPLQGAVLDRLAGSLVGDGKDPDLFFVCVDGICQMVCVDFEMAYENYSTLIDKYDPFVVLSDDSCNSLSLESRSWGVICSIDQEAGIVNTVDDSVSFRKQRAALHINKKIK